MAYKKPGVKVIQEFQAAAPALAAFTLPAVAIGRAYQLVNNQLAGAYSGDATELSFPGLIPGQIIDFGHSDDSDPMAAIKKPISVTLKNIRVELVSNIAGNALAQNTVTNAATGAFNDVVSGDYIRIEAGPNEGEYRVRSKIDANNLLLERPVAQGQAGISVSVIRNIEEGTLTRDETSGFDIREDDNLITLPGGLSMVVGGVPRTIQEASVYVSYRALRNDLSSEVTQFAGVTSLTQIFGAGQITPANDLAYAISIMLQNTVAPVHGLGLDENALADEVLSYTAAADVLESTDMYALVPLTQNPAVHTMFSRHVTESSQPDRKRERVVIVNSRLLTGGLLKGESTTVTTANNSRQIVGTKTDGHGSQAAPNGLTAGVAGEFASVQLGDTVLIVGGTGVTPGAYGVAEVLDDSNLVLDAAFVTAGTPTNISYYIYRSDGLGGSGAQLYDRNGGFLGLGVAPGHFLVIKNGPHVGRYRIATVPSDVELTVTPPIPGVIGVLPSITYEIERNLSKVDQAEAIAGYSQAFQNRRVVHVWPDVVKAPVGQTLRNVPGYFACAAIGALTTGLPTQQGFTNLAISGFLGCEHSNRYFTEDQLDIIADGGTMILTQGGQNEPLFIRHQLTTDRSSIKFQEFSVTKNVDFVAKYIRSAYGAFIGQYNITDTTLDALRTVAEAILMFLRKTSSVPRFGAVVRNGRLVSIKESLEQIDTVVIRFQFDMPIPLNNIDIYVAV